MGFSASRGGFSPYNFWPHCSFSVKIPSMKEVTTKKLELQEKELAFVLLKKKPKKDK